VCVLVALGTQSSMRMRHIAMCGLPACAVFFHITSQKCTFLFSLLLLRATFETLIRTERDVMKNYAGLHLKYPLFLPDFNET
jgi:hypothetical protein